jgi:hypothetical protein
MNEDELAKRRAARRENPSSLPANLSAYPWHDESTTDLRAWLEAMQNLRSTTSSCMASPKSSAALPSEASRAE